MTTRKSWWSLQPCSAYYNVFDKSDRWYNNRGRTGYYNKGWVNRHFGHGNGHIWDWRKEDDDDEDDDDKRTISPTPNTSSLGTTLAPTISPAPTITETPTEIVDPNNTKNPTDAPSEDALPTPAPAPSTVLPTLTEIPVSDGPTSATLPPTDPPAIGAPTLAPGTPAPVIVPGLPTLPPTLAPAIVSGLPTLDPATAPIAPVATPTLPTLTPVVTLTPTVPSSLPPVTEPPTVTQVPSVVPTTRVSSFQTAPPTIFSSAPSGVINTQRNGTLAANQLNQNTRDSSSSGWQPWHVAILAFMLSLVSIAAMGLAVAYIKIPFLSSLLQSGPSGGRVGVAPIPDEKAPLSSSSVREPPQAAEDMDARTRRVEV